MSIEIIPATPAKRYCKCDGCGKKEECLGSVVPSKWNRVSIYTDNPEKPLYGDCGGWPSPDATFVDEHEYCEDCSGLIVGYMRACKGVLPSAYQAGQDVYIESIRRNVEDSVFGLGGKKPLFVSWLTDPNLPSLFSSLASSMYGPQECGWIDVTKRKPMEAIEVLLCCQQGSHRWQTIGHFTNLKWHGNNAIDVTHWKPLTKYP
jgi:hypothetical protein